MERKVDAILREIANRKGDEVVDEFFQQPFKTIEDLESFDKELGSPERRRALVSFMSALV